MSSTYPKLDGVSPHPLDKPESDRLHEKAHDEECAMSRIGFVDGSIRLVFTLPVLSVRA
jgi:hypothetical protein